MKKLQKWGICSIITGVVLLAVLVGVGAFIKNVLQAAPLSALEWTPGDGNEHCGSSRFWYYFWNLTNLDATLAGEKGSYNLIGPYTFDVQYCNIDEEQLSPTTVAYRDYEKGTYFNAAESGAGLSIYDPIIAANPAYVTVLSNTGGETGLLIAITAPGLGQIISTMQSPDFINEVLVGAIPLALGLIKSTAQSQGIDNVAAAGVALTHIAANVMMGPTTTLDDFFNDPTWVAPVLPVIGFATWAAGAGLSPDPIPAPLGQALFDSWVTSQGYALVKFAQDPADLAATFLISTDLANYLAAYFGLYLIVPASIDPAATAALSDMLIYQQWANNTLQNTSLLAPMGLSGFEVDLTNPSNITLEDVEALWDTTNVLALTNLTGIQAWMGAALGNTTLQATLAVAYPTITAEQFGLLFNWLYNFLSNVVPTLAKQQFGISDLNDLAYAQWGGLVLGQSLADLAPDKLNFPPEIAAFTNSAPYTAAQAKQLLNGTYPLFDATNLGTFMVLAGSGDFGTVQAMFGINDTQAITLAGYFQYMMNNLAVPMVQGAFAEGSGMFVQRTVQEWLFTAQDPLLITLQQPSANAAIVGNETDDLTTLRQTEKLIAHIYTKGGSDDDLHASLLREAGNGEDTISYYAVNTSTKGYTGSQYMPYNDVDNPKYPLDLYVSQNKRVLPLKNVGTSDYQGVTVRQLNVDPDCWKSSSEDSAQGTEDFVHENVTLHDGVTHDTYNPADALSTSIKAQWIQVEPFLGTTVNANFALQLNLKIEPTELFFPNIRPAYAPILWGRKGGQATEDDVKMIKTQLYGARSLWQALIGVGVAIGAIGIIVGIVLYRKGSRSTKVIRLT